MISQVKKQIISLSILLCGISLGCVFSTYTYDYKIEKFAEKCVNQNALYANNLESKTLLRISEKVDTEHRYFDLYNTFYWSSLCNGCREIVNNNCVDNANTQITLATQSVFSTTKNNKSGDFFYLHDGQYFTYFGEETCESISVRYNCDSFIFISDEYAKTLLIKYGLYNENEIMNSYKRLITEEKYCVLEINIDGIGIKKFCINNIIATSHRQGLHMSNLHGYFAVVYLKEKYSADYHFAFEAEFKNGNYCVKKLLNTIIDGGYDTNNYSYNFYQRENEGFTSIESLNDEFLSIVQLRNDDSFMYCLIVSEIITCVSYFVLVVLVVDKRDDATNCQRLILYHVQFLISLIFLLLISFFNFYYVWSIIPLIAIISLTISNDRVKKLLLKKGKSNNEARYYLINI